MILNGIQFETEKVLDWRVSEYSAASTMELDPDTLKSLRMAGFGPHTEVGDDGEIYYRYGDLAAWDLLTDVFQSEFARQISLAVKQFPFDTA